MQLNQETLIEVAQSHGDSHVRPLEIELINLKRQIVTDKQIVQQQRLTINGKAERCRPPDVSTSTGLPTIQCFLQSALVLFWIYK